MQEIIRPGLQPWSVSLTLLSLQQTHDHETYPGHLQTVLCLHSWNQSSKECISYTVVNFPLA